MSFMSEDTTHHYNWTNRQTIKQSKNRSQRQIPSVNGNITLRIKDRKQTLIIRSLSNQQARQSKRVLLLAVECYIFPLIIAKQEVLLIFRILLFRKVLINNQTRRYRLRN